jgi:GPH family glycoside/pentoside/hexuronide:cation symporter
MMEQVKSSDRSESTKVTLGTKLGYAVGDFGANLAFQVVSFYLLFFFTDIFGILPAMAAIIFLVAKIWDAVSDPIMGTITDRTRSRWGSKRPYLLFGAIPLGLVIYLLFLAPDLTQNLKFAYGMATFVLFCTVITIVNVPFLALTPALTPDSHERSVVTGYRVVLGLLGTLVAAGATMPLVSLLGSDPVRSFRSLGLIYGGIVAAVTLVCFFTVKERVVAVKAKPIKLKESWTSLLINKPFLIITAGTFLHMIGMNILAIIVNYYFKYNLNAEHMISVGFLCIFVTAALFIPFYVVISKKTSKKFTYNLGMGIVVIGLLLVFMFGSKTVNLFGLDLPLIFVFLFICGMGLSTNWLSPWSMIPDTVEYAEWKTGNRNEGILYGIFYFVFKLGTALAGFLVGNLLARSGYVANIAQTAPALAAIRLLFTLIPAAFIIGGMIVIGFYPINAASHTKMTEEIKRRVE